MKIAAMFADGSGGTVDRPDPKAVDDFVVVKIRSAPMVPNIRGSKVSEIKTVLDLGKKPLAKS